MTIWTSRQALATAAASRTSPSARSMGKSASGRGSLVALASIRTLSPAAISSRTILLPSRPVAPVTRYFTAWFPPVPAWPTFDYYHRQRSKTIRPRITGRRMPQLTIKPVETSREKQQFLDLPWQINRGDPNWIPPLRQNQQELVGYKHHPFFREAEGQTFLALEGDRPVGRVMAIVNHAH